MKFYILIKYQNMIMAIVTAALAIKNTFDKDYVSAMVLVICTAMFHTFYDIYKEIVNRQKNSSNDDT